MEHQSVFFPDGWKLFQLIIQIAPQKPWKESHLKKASITRQNRKEVVAAIATEIFPPELEQSNWKNNLERPTRIQVSNAYKLLQL